LAQAIYNAALDKIEENAGGVGETINELKDFTQKAKEFAKNYKGSKAEGSKAKSYDKFAEKAKNDLLKNRNVPDSLKAKLEAAALAAAPAWEFFKTGKPCTATGNSGGGDSFFKHQLADCAEYSRLIEAEMQAMEEVSLEIDCNCVGTPSDCNEITQIMNRIKSANGSDSKMVTFDKNTLLTDYRNEGKSGLTGIDIGGKCYHLFIENKFSTGTISLDMKDFELDASTEKINLKDQRGEVAVSIHRLPKTRGSFDDLVGYLGFGGKKPDGKITVTGNKLKEIFPGTSQARCYEVAELINKYAVEYGLTSTERLAHFIGQIGAETQLKNLDEGSYSATRILTAEKTRTTYASGGKRYLKYCSLFRRIFCRSWLSLSGMRP